MRHSSATQEMQNEQMYLYKRSNGFWYFRRRLPSDLLGIIEPKRFHYSLGTKNKSEALLHLSAALAESESIIRKERDGLNQAPPIVRPLRWRKRRIDAERAKRRRTRVFCQYSESELLDLVSRWFRTKARETEDAYRGSFALNNSEEREEIVKDLDHEFSYLMGELEPMDELIGFREVRSILDEEDCAIPTDCLEDPLFRKFYGLVREGLLRLNGFAISLVKTGRLPESQNGKNDFVSAPAVFSLNGTSTKSVTLHELIERFEQSPRRQHLRKATRAEYRLIYRALREHVGGETPVHLITRDMILNVADTFRNLPSRATLSSPKVPLRQLASDAKERGLPQAHPKTYNKKVEQISALFSYAVTEQLLSYNPAKSLALPEPPTSGEDKAFTVEQLNAIFSGDWFRRFSEESGSQFIPNHTLRPCFYWQPLIALYEGCRSGESLQLMTANVREQSGVTALKIEGDVKNQQSIRWVPLHPKLIELGFLRYVETVKHEGYKMLFPDAKQACDGKYSTWFQKPWAKYLTKVGVKTGRKECFHAFRHTWVGALRRADVPEEIRKRLGGWKIHGAEGSYGPEHLPRLLKYLEKVEYPGLDLNAFCPELK
jgi:site-specific recombinase XerD